MPYDANPAATHDPTAGVVVPVNWLDLINSNFAALGAAWTAYTPTWTASVSNPSTGNGTLTGRYRQIGKTVNLLISLTLGTTTATGSGTWFFSLPVAARQIHTGTANSTDTGNAEYLGICRVEAGLAKAEVLHISTAARWTNTSPFTWGSTDTLTLSLTYEAA